MNHSVSESTDEELSESLNDAAESIQQSSSSSSGVGGGGGSSSNSTASSSDSSEAGYETQIDSLELAQIGGEVFRLPRGLCENANIFYEFFSLDTWNFLPQQLQAQLRMHLPRFSHLLPPEVAAAEQSRTLASLFRDGGTGLQRFGETPLGSLQRQLEEGNLRPDVLKLHHSIAKSQRRERRFQHCERVSHLAKELFISRERLLRNVYKSAPDTDYYTMRMQRKRIKPELGDNKMSAVRARKRYCGELQTLFKELKFNIGDISTDEDDPEALTFVERQDIEKLPNDDAEDLTAMTKNAGKKCIYDTFFRRQLECEDEDVIRTTQESKFTRLNDKNFKQYLRDYKRRKMTNPHLPEFDTTDIRLRDVCTRAHVTAILKPGRKPKTKLNEPPALVPIQQKNSKDFIAEEVNENTIRFDDGGAADDDDDDDASESLNVVDVGNEIEVKQEDMMVSQHLLRHNMMSNELTQQILKTPERERMLMQQQMPKLEPIESSQMKQTKFKTIISPTTTTTIANLNSPSPLQQHMKPPMIKLSPNAMTPPALMLDTHACYFSLIRDLFCATPNHRMRFEDLKLKLETWLENPIAALNPWYNQSINWCEMLQSALNFLAGSFSVLPADYVPYIEFKTQMNIYQWIGASRDSDARLSTLYNFWQQRRSNDVGTKINIQQKPENFIIISNTNTTTATTTTTLPNSVLGGGIQITAVKTTENHKQQQEDDLSIKSAIDHENLIQIQAPTPPPRFPTNWKVCAATPTEMLEFQRQERLRFEQPHRAFTYHMHGYESVVGPVKGIYSQTLALTKARGHSIMIDDRPNFVTILTLVRDATARLPNGEGTRAEISELLKCSQYINPNAAENVLQTIVSGALDRMHAGHDPCVRYDPKRKIWIYLHRNRSEAEFERMHQHNQTLSKQKQKSNRKPKIGGNVIKKEESSDGTIKIIQTDNVTATMNKINLSPVPALVPSSSSGGSPMIKKTNIQSPQQQSTVWQQVTLPTKCLPVPPLKYNIPSPQQQQQQQPQQKSLLKTPIQMQRVSIDKLQAQLLSSNSRLKASTPGGGVTTNQVKPYAFSVQQQASANKTNMGTSPPTISSINAMRNATMGTTTPILVSTPTGLQTVHVAGAKTSTTTTQSPKLTATVGGKKVSLTKSVVLNQMNQQKTTQQINKPKQQLTNIIMPIDNQQKQQPQLQDQLQNVLINSSQLIATSTDQQQQQIQPQAKNIIRLMPASAAAGSKHPVQIIGQRILAQTTVRQVQQQQQQLQQQAKAIAGGGAVTLTGKSIGTTNATTGGGSTVVKMSAQAFAALQQKQGQQIVVKPTAIGNQTKTQRILVGNTALSANKNIIFQPITGQKIQNTTNVVISKKQNDGGGASSPSSLSPKVITTGGKIQTLNTANLTPQQQRVLIQNLKQQQQQQQFKVIPTLQSPAAGAARQIETQSTIAGATNVVASSRIQGGTVQRVINLADAKAQNLMPLSPSGGVTRIIRSANNLSSSSAVITPSTTTTTTTATGQLTSQTATTGQIITLDNLLQRQGATLRVAGNTSGAGVAKVVSAANFLQLAATSSAQNIATSSGGNISTTSSLPNQFQVISPSRNIITLSPSAQTRLISTQAGGGNPTVLTTAQAATMNAKLAAGGRLVTTNATKVLGKAATLIGSNAGAVGGGATTTMNITNLQGKPLLLPTMKNVVRTVGSGTSTQQLQNVVLGGQTMKIQGSVTNAQRGAQVMSATPMQTVIMGNQILRLQQIPSSQQQQQGGGQQQQRITIATSNATGGISASPVVISSSSNSEGGTITTTTSTTASTTRVGSPTVIPKTLVLGSTGQTIRLQPATVGGNLQKNIITGATNIIGKATTITNSNTTTSGAPGGGNVLFAVQGGGQILLSPAFQGGTTINLKQLQNMKVVSLPMAKTSMQGDNKLLNSPKLIQLKSNSNNSNNSSSISSTAVNDGGTGGNVSGS